jgi:hypothetical protein
VLSKARYGSLFWARWTLSTSFSHIV